MKEYFSLLLVTVAVTVVFGYLVRGSRLERFVRLGLSLLLFYTAIAPLGELIASGEFTPPEYEDTDTSEGEYIEVARSAFEEGIKKYVCDEMSLDKDDVLVECENFDFEMMRAGRICVYLSGRAALADYKAIEKMIEAAGLGDAVCMLR